MCCSGIYSAYRYGHIVLVYQKPISSMPRVAKEYDSSMNNTIGLLRGVYEVNSNNDAENGNNDTESGSFRIR